MQRYFQEQRQHLLVAFATHMVSVMLFQAATFSEMVVESPDLMLRVINLSTAVFIWLALYTLLWFVLIYSDNEPWINRWTVGIAGVQMFMLVAIVTVWPEFLYEVDGIVSQGTMTVFGLTTVEYTVLDRQLTWRFQAIAAAGIAAHLTAGGISIRNPLSIAQGYAELAETTGDPSHFATLHRAHERMETMIEELLILAQTGESVGETVSIPLAAQVSKTWAMTDTQETELEITLPDTYEITADPDLLQHVFENLFRNAAEHGPTQQTDSDITDAPLVVTVGVLTREGSTVGFYVEDNGDGIPSTIRE